eukprot:TRINITY_DN72280_c0_g1_i1.p1 TRINITY_DN72280_c0_g1~~TRINITY_DN72280_c0_g1_i1.p1  ORF type:complete len:272 (+),score=43.10 TRINITY_DN72280_c0_g1_i1:112-816(+)
MGTQRSSSGAQKKQCKPRNLAALAFCLLLSSVGAARPDGVVHSSAQGQPSPPRSSGPGSGAPGSRPAPPVSSSSPPLTSQTNIAHAQQGAAARTQSTSAVAAPTKSHDSETKEKSEAQSSQTQKDSEKLKQLRVEIQETKRAIEKDDEEARKVDESAAKAAKREAGAIRQVYEKEANADALRAKEAMEEADKSSTLARGSQPKTTTNANVNAAQATSAQGSSTARTPASKAATK